jgi:antitoxin MazE
LDVSLLIPVCACSLGDVSSTFDRFGFAGNNISIRRIGNSQGVVIPKPVLAQLGLDAEAGTEMTIEEDALVLRRPAGRVRAGWAEAAKRIAGSGDDELVMGEFGNAGDSELIW